LPDYLQEWSAGLNNERRADPKASDQRGVVSCLYEIVTPLRAYIIINDYLPPAELQWRMRKQMSCLAVMNSEMHSIEGLPVTRLSVILLPITLLSHSFSSLVSGISCIFIFLFFLPGRISIFILDYKRLTIIMCSLFWEERPSD